MEGIISTTADVGFSYGAPIDESLGASSQNNKNRPITMYIHTKLLMSLSNHALTQYAMRHAKAALAARMTTSQSIFKRATQYFISNLAL